MPRRTVFEQIEAGREKALIAEIKQLRADAKRARKVIDIAWKVVTCRQRYLDKYIWQLEEVLRALEPATKVEEKVEGGA